MAINIVMYASTCHYRITLWDFLWSSGSKLHSTIEATSRKMFKYYALVYYILPYVTLLQITFYTILFAQAIWEIPYKEILSSHMKSVLVS